MRDAWPLTSRVDELAVIHGVLESASPVSGGAGLVGIGVLPAVPADTAGDSGEPGANVANGTGL